ncbi:MAG: hypothetical protein HZA23_04900 [Nitrospirae bacterium]|nr:hypothetical protein [Nitrospirota bacterium]
MGEHDKKTTLLALFLGVLVLISFTLGVLAYLPAENRAKKIQETLEKHKAKGERKAPPWSD